ncbi:hypothetical protein ASZ90_009064 [hydrocarbon metagenome]|uniref:Uncharacterized protein n=1 Tax=hydrocarbon metagenome TaxID=938273 RepID=A0A0W8FJV2_9ZZZZ
MKIGPVHISVFGFSFAEAVLKDGSRYGRPGWRGKYAPYRFASRT